MLDIFHRCGAQVVALDQASSVQAIDLGVLRI
jgi:hypothetical protein